MLEAIGLSKIYNGHSALTDLHLKVAPGEVFCLLGANGAGKTTTINLFLGFTPPTSGQARVNGVSVTEKPLDTKRDLAYIPEQVNLYRNLSGLENLAYFSTLAGFHYELPALREFLTEAGLQPGAMQQRTGGYSKGMRQKVGIAIALAKRAKALLLDEPTSGLDPKASNEFSRLIQELSARDVAVLMATHDLFRAKESGTHIGIMREGKLRRSLLTHEISHTQLERLYLEEME